MKKKWIVAFALLAVVLAAVVFREQVPKFEEFSPTGETLILDNGTKLELWQGNMGSMAYYMPGGIRLLEVRHPEGDKGPENVHTVNVDFTLADLPQAAQTAILDHYETLGILYDLDAVLKQELAFYREKGQEFTAGLVDQYTYPYGQEGNVVYFDTLVFIPIAADSEAPIPQGSRLLKNHIYRAGFDRETGTLVETSDWEES